MFYGYQNFIFLGYYCGIVKDLEILGLTNKSYLFDWASTNLEKLIKGMECGFMDFMYYDNLE